MSGSARGERKILLYQGRKNPTREKEISRTSRISFRPPFTCSFPGDPFTIQREDFLATNCLFSLVSPEGNLPVCQNEPSHTELISAREFAGSTPPVSRNIY